LAIDYVRFPSSFRRRNRIEKTKVARRGFVVPLIGGALGTPTAMAQPQLAGPAAEFTVLAAEGQRVGAAEQAIHDAGGTVVKRIRRSG
jgi:hypothetical protein